MGRLIRFSEIDRKFISSLSYTGNIILVAHYEDDIIKMFGPMFQDAVNYVIRKRISKKGLLGISVYMSTENIYKTGIRQILKR